MTSSSNGKINLHNETMLPVNVVNDDNGNEMVTHTRTHSVQRTEYNGMAVRLAAAYLPIKLNRKEQEQSAEPFLG